MQSIVILKSVEMSNTPSFDAGQKVRVNAEIADMLVDRGFAKYDIDEKPVTDKAKEFKAKKITAKPKITNT
ncbi:hypothetical protein A2125_02235 [Candidatus Woesebacteria bacterium GWB1_43_5]|uniref:Uncharacterized protein n=1 Tax=Candidatus Woesebacteria bacterium GWB1_43_5 TaxID=1802474 RepID=A0A1F7WS10_9BACT|nr:MAG: hypothetical protein A2125_02235 [Candidatus Woesebacteria bacterium GWB1_43_5]